MFKPAMYQSKLQNRPLDSYDQFFKFSNQTVSYPDLLQNIIRHSSRIPLANEQGFTRQLAPFQHGPERPEERPPHTHHVDWASMFPNEVILHGPTNRRLVSLTFDDGPDDVWTPQILDVLNRLNIKGAFMCVGQRIQQHPHG